MGKCSPNSPVCHLLEKNRQISAPKSLSPLQPHQSSLQEQRKYLIHLREEEKFRQIHVQGIPLCHVQVLGGLVPMSAPAHPQGDTGQWQCLTWLCSREVMPGLGTAALCRGCGRWGVLNPSSACKWSVKIAQIPSSAGICCKPWACWDCCSHLGHRLEHGDTHRSPVCHCTPRAPTNPLWFREFQGCLHGNQPRMI